MESDIASFKKDIRNDVGELKKLMKESKRDTFTLQIQNKMIKKETKAMKSELVLKTGAMQ